MMLTLVLALLSAIAVPPKPATYITDKAGVLDAARAHAVNEKLAQFERDTSNQILVYIDRTLPPDTTIEQFANDAMHQWGVGQKGKDNGAVLFLFTGDRKMRIEVGYGLEAVLTDAKSKNITNTIIKPRLKASDYNAAVEHGVDAILATARVEENKGTGQTVQEANRHSRIRIPVDSPDHSFDGDGIVWGIAAFLFLGVAGLIFLLVRSGRMRGSGVTPAYRNTPPTSWDPSPSSWSSSSSDSFSSSNSSSSSSSGFDGGGGDSGGGGASDSW